MGHKGTIIIPVTNLPNPRFPLKLPITLKFLNHKRPLVFRMSMGSCVQSFCSYNLDRWVQWVCLAWTPWQCHNHSLCVISVLCQIAEEWVMDEGIIHEDQTTIG
uniref:SFRICE_031544 n=1 Tax=Spodoptera frugiperda TaxID=7108 RepID=A0A2H1V119_SPOFR